MPKETTPEGITPADAVMGQFFYVVAHEMGHAMFDILQVPVFGNGEDAADHFSVYIMLQFGKDQSRRTDFGRSVLLQEVLAEFGSDGAPCGLL